MGQERAIVLHDPSRLGEPEVIDVEWRVVAPKPPVLRQLLSWLAAAMDMLLAFSAMMSAVALLCLSVLALGGLVVVMVLWA
jgi:hypothetical protein